MNQDQNELSPVILMLAKWVKGEQVSDDALNRMLQFSFVVHDLKGNLQLTPSGRSTLQEFGLI